MVVKIFTLGRPGSGKSSSAHHIIGMAERKGWSAIHINDYEILYKMFQADIDHRKFRPTACNGFDVLDFSVFDAALREVERRVQKLVASDMEELIIIEFARDDYRKALRQFSQSFLQDSYFLFIDADIDTCLRRIHLRVNHPTSPDDHPSYSDDIFRSHYRKDNRNYMHFKLKEDYGISKRIEVIDNKGQWQNFIEDLNRFLEGIFTIEVPTAEKAAVEELSKQEAISLVPANA